MSDEARRLIGRMERETGQRIDANDGDNPAMAGLFGALVRMLGGYCYKDRDDVVTGTVIRHPMMAEYAAEQHTQKIISEMIDSGMSPEDVRDIFGGKS